MYEKFIKRGSDLTGATVILILISPVFLVLALLIKLTSPGPVIFTQARSGKDGKVFLMRKFRTMTYDNDVHDKTTDNQMTKIGKLLRAFSLDELPQLINVIRGDMSFIGPRPWITPYYDHMNDQQRKRYQVRPGITGIAQVYGRNNLTIHQKIDYDLRYVDNVGLREDLKVIFLTFVAVFSREGEVMGKGGIHEELDVLRKQFEDHNSADTSGKFTEKEGQEA